MMYLLPRSSSQIDLHGNFGLIVTPSAKGGLPSPILEGRQWALDNGAYSGFNEENFVRFMTMCQPYCETCMFVAAPDVVGDCMATMALYDEWHGRIASMGYPVAFVAQDGQEEHDLPACNWLFIGGTTAWKLGDGARRCIAAAQKRGIPVHVGRVNSLSRFRYFQGLGCDSADGTHPIYEPRNIHRWLTQVVAQDMML